MLVYALVFCMVIDAYTFSISIINAVPRPRPLTRYIIEMGFNVYADLISYKSGFFIISGSVFVSQIPFMALIRINALLRVVLFILWHCASEDRFVRISRPLSELPERLRNIMERLMVKASVWDWLVSFAEIRARANIMEFWRVTDVAGFSRGVCDENWFIGKWSMLILLVELVVECRLWNFQCL